MRPVDPRALFYRHPFAWLVTSVFLFAVLVRTAYYLRLIPAGENGQLEIGTLTTITAILLVATIASWIAAIALTADG